MQKSSTQLTLVQYSQSSWNNEVEDDQCGDYERLITHPESLDICNTEPSLNESFQLSTDQSSITPSVEGIPSDIAVGPGTPPVRPRNIRFPSSNFSGKLRSFSIAWYRDYTWLEYSVSRDAVFCFACRLFAPRYRISEVFTLNGFSYWKNVSGKNGALSVHNNSAILRNFMLAMEEYKVNASHSASIPHRLKLED